MPEIPAPTIAMLFRLDDLLIMFCAVSAPSANELAEMSFTGTLFLDELRSSAGPGSLLAVGAGDPGGRAVRNRGHAARDLRDMVGFDAAIAVAGIGVRSWTGQRFGTRSARRCSWNQHG